MQIGSIRYMQTGTPTIIPTSATVPGSTTQAFDFSGFDGGLVAWSDTLGTVTPVGLYTAPAATGSVQTDNVVVTGLGNTGQSASATVTIPAVLTSATAFTLTGPSSGFVLNASTNFTFTPNGLYTGTITPSMTSLTGTWAPASLTWSGPATAKTATFTPSATGSGMANGTASPTLTPPGGVTYTSNARTLGVAPAAVSTAATGLTLALTGGGTAWTPGTPGSPTFTASAGTVTAQTITSATAATLTYSSPGTPQTVTITDPSTSDTTTLVIASVYNVLAVAPYGVAYTGLGLGYTVYNPDGTVFQAHTTAGVNEIASTGIYQVQFSAVTSFIGLVVWDAPAGIDPYVREIQPSSAINTPSPTAIAAAVWQDATAGDFTVTGSIGKYIMTGVTINLAQSGFTPRNLGTVADAALTVGDALLAAICAAAGKETVVGTTYTIKSPSTGTTIRTFTLDSASSPSSRN